jgi:hypothetical protein
MFDCQTLRDSTPASIGACLLTLSLALASTGCEEAVNQLGGKCSKIEKSYKQTLEEEKTELDAESGSSSERAHLGLTLSNELLTKVVNRALQPIVKGALSLTSSIQGFGIEPSGDVIRVDLQADGQCDHCFKVGIELDGSLALQGPAGTSNVPLNGALRVIAPLKLTPGDEKSAALKLDMKESKKILKSRLDARLGQLPRWASAVRGPIENQLNKWANKWNSQLTSKSVTLVEFDGPDFGIPDFQIFPVQLKTEAASDSVFTGFATNVAALNTSDVPAIDPVTELADNQNMALSFQPQLIVNALSLLIGIDKVSRTYGLSGDANPDGSLHVTLSQFQIGASGGSSNAGDAGAMASMRDAGGMADAGSGSGSAGVPVALGFKLHQFKPGGFCFSAGANASGSVGIAESSLKATLNDVEFTSSSAPSGVVDLANWAGAQFIQESQTLVESSLSANSVDMANSELELGPLEVALQPNTLVLRGQSNLNDSSGNGSK